MTAPRRLQLAVCLHQPLSASAEEVDGAVAAHYLPLVAALETQPRLRLALHVGGHLLDALTRRHEPVTLRLRDLWKRGQVELLGGLFYGGQPAMLPERDVRAQVQMAQEFWEALLGAAPRGFWLPAPAWVAELPRLLAGTGLQWGLVSAERLGGGGGRPGAWASLERGDARLGMLICDPALAGRIAGAPPSSWAAGLGEAQAAVVVGEQAPAGGWMAWAAALAAVPALELVLPSEDGGAPRGAMPPAALTSAAEARLDGPAQRRLQGRMLRTSAALARAIGVMEDEESAEGWGDGLATAQRLALAGQAAEAYAGEATAVADRRAAWQHLARAETTIAEACRQDGAAPAAEVQAQLAGAAQDLDGDGIAEPWLVAGDLGAWVDPTPGGLLKALEDRRRGADLLDAGADHAGAQLAWLPAAAVARDDVDEAAGPCFVGDGWRPASGPSSPPTRAVEHARLGDAPGAPQAERQQEVGPHARRWQLTFALVEAPAAQLGWRLTLPWRAQPPAVPSHAGAPLAAGRRHQGIGEVVLPDLGGGAMVLTVTPTASCAWRAAADGLVLTLAGPCPAHGPVVVTLSEAEPGGGTPAA